MCTNNLEHLANMLCTLEVFVEQFSNFITMWSKDEVFMMVAHDIYGEFPCGIQHMVGFYECLYVFKESTYFNIIGQKLDKYI